MSDQENLRTQDLQEDAPREAREETGNPSHQEPPSSQGPSEGNASGDGASGASASGADRCSTATANEPGREEPGRAEPEDSGAVAALKKELEGLQAENSELKNQYLRKQADMENYRKRMIRDKEDAVSYANQQLLLDLTAVIDDFERAIASAEESRDYDAFHDGVVLIEKQLVSMLERKWGLKRLDSEGQEFDPQKHEAVTAEPREGDETSMVLEEFQKGYLLHDRVLRAARVKVSTPGKG
ncbi:molecular chaperone GrpE [Alkalispirochaeta sphaeroplastigenens]|uniref:Protein GrpE n=1 Tax=Alkalispirochaeta sphaeroplastigenens TaxID=1187066 RepID=A0A2S4JUW3_9SPIO|nr:nucleotide exchange factor GrpE [Alkalispirochaeta sphaeroplastigenens]POR03280.1 molecular chaperone GrpE [Alkalispirochaeta sphaeroplastigenens]